jgi:hypothetical protein
LKNRISSTLSCFYLGSLSFTNLFNLYPHAAATAKAVVLTPKAPCTPSLSILKNTVTTMTFNGIPNKFITTLRWLSGKYFERSVPIVGKYMPTHDSKRKRLIIRIERIAPGCDTADDSLPHAATMGDRRVERTGRDVNVEIMRGVEELIDMVALPMANAANPNIPTAKLSVEIAVLFPLLSTFFDDVNCPNNVDPRRQQAMKHENTVPYGVLIAGMADNDDLATTNLEKYELIALLTAGGLLIFLGGIFCCCCCM